MGFMYLLKFHWPLACSSLWVFVLLTVCRILPRPFVQLDIFPSSWNFLCLLLFCNLCFYYFFCYYCFTAQSVYYQDILFDLNIFKPPDILYDSWHFVWLLTFCPTADILSESWTFFWLLTFCPTGEILLDPPPFFHLPGVLFQRIPCWNK